MDPPAPSPSPSGGEVSPPAQIRLTKEYAVCGLVAHLSSCRYRHHGVSTRFRVLLLSRYLENRYLQIPSLILNRNNEKQANN